MFWCSETKKFSVSQADKTKKSKKRIVVNARRSTISVGGVGSIDPRELGFSKLHSLVKVPM